MLPDNASALRCVFFYILHRYAGYRQYEARAAEEKRNEARFRSGSDGAQIAVDK